MKIILIAVGLVLLIALIADAYVRLAPVDPERWHLDTTSAEPGDRGAANSFQAVRTLDRSPAEVLAEADRVILGTPRTRRIAGSLQDGKVTYETRSLIWGFPDYTTVWTEDGAARPPVIGLYGRARFGASDMGVNKARIEGWLDRLGLAS